MIFYSNEKGIIPSTGIKNLEGVHDLNLKLPSIAIGVFSEHLYKDIVKKYNCVQIGNFGGSSISRPIHIINYKDKEFTLFLAGISGPWISSDIEELNVNGVNTFIIFGNCGVLDSKIEDCSIIIPTKAYRDEGTSYHYLPDSESVELNEKYKEMFEKISNKPVTVENMGKKNLAYEINGNKQGNYAIFYYNTSENNISDIQQHLRNDENVMKHITVRHNLENENENQAENDSEAMEDDDMEM